MPDDFLSEGRPGQKQWQEFRASYASARLFAWLLDDLDAIAPDYLRDLQDRINLAIVSGEGLAEDDPTYDGAAILQGPNGRGATFIEKEDALLLEDQLFPNRQHDPQAFEQASRGLAVVALHSALESYCASVGIIAQRMPLPRVVQGFLASAPGSAQLEAELSLALTDLDETRHVIVHHRGMVSDRYVNNVGYNKWVVGEFRLVKQSDLERFADAAWKTAERVHQATSPSSESSGT